MSAAARIDRFLATVHSADNMASARDKLAEATDLLRDVKAGRKPAAKIRAGRSRKG